MCRNLPILAQFAAFTVPCRVLIRPTALLGAREGLRMILLSALVWFTWICLLCGSRGRYVLGF